MFQIISRSRTSSLSKRATEHNIVINGLLSQDMTNNTIQSATNCSISLSPTANNTSSMDELVWQIRENLKLKGQNCRMSGSSLRTSIGGKSSRRVSPYSVPARNGDSRGKKCNKDTNEDPYQLLQALLKQGNLISEAVRRLQENPSRSFNSKSRGICRSPSSVESCVSPISTSPACTKTSICFAAT